MSNPRDIGYSIAGMPGIDAAAGVESAEQTGPWVNRHDPVLWLSASAMVQARAAALADTENITITAQIEDADDAAGTGAAAYGAAADPKVETNTSGGVQDTRAVLEYDVDLSGAREYVRIKATVTPSAATACDMSGVWVLGGANKNPA